MPRSDAGDRQLAADPAYGVEELRATTARPAPGCRCRRVARVADVDVDREEDRVAVVQRDLERLVEAGVEPALADLGHLVGPHVLVGHPLHGLGAGPVAAQPHLQEPVAAQGAGLDQPAHRLAVPVQRAELDVAGVGVGVEVDHRDPAEAEVPRDAGGVGEGDRVVAAEHERDRAGGRDGVHRLLEGVQRALDLAGRHLDVAHVDHGDVLQGVDPQREVGPRAVLRQVAVCRMADGPKRVPGRCDVPPSKGAPTTTTSAAASAPASSTSTAGTPRKVMSGPNWAPYRVMGYFLPVRREPGAHLRIP